MKGNEYNITYLEACKILGKSRKTISRYIKKGLIKTEKIKSQREQNGDTSHFLK